MSLSSDELDGLTKDDLLEVAAELDLDVSATMRKDEIRAAIDAAQGTTASPEAAGEPSEARTKFLAGEMTWREYVEQENVAT